MGKHQVLAAFVGLQWGDEGKGKLVEEEVFTAIEETGKRTWVGRYQGGANAGHTSFVRDKIGNLVKFDTHAAPSGLTTGAEIFIGPQVAFDAVRFLEELNKARTLFGYSGGIHISERTGVLFDYHKRLDGWQEDTGEKKVGTTRQGMGPFYMDNANRRTRFTFADYVSDRFPDRLKEILEAKRLEIGAAKIWTPTYLDELVALHDPIRKELKGCECRLEYRLREALNNGENIILEGAQGTLLDEDMGTLPDVTPSHLLAPHAFPSLGLPREKFMIIGVEKFYPTRVGSGYMPTLAEDDFGAETQKNAGEVGVTTGRKRRVGYPDWVIIKYAVMINDVDEIIITRIDNVQDREIKVCTAYDINCQIVGEVPLKLETAKPVYSDARYKWHLWDGPADLSDPLKVDKALASKRKEYVEKGFKGLPEGLREYLRSHDDYVGVPTGAISIGPARGELVAKGFKPERMGYRICLHEDDFEEKSD